MSPDVIDFIVNHIDSIEQLEVLLLLKEGKARTWTAVAVNEVIRSSESSIVKHLQKLLTVGILRMKENSNDAYLYAPISPELETIVDKIAHYYRDRRTLVIECIYSKSLRGIRNFSEAFKFKKEDK